MDLVACEKTVDLDAWPPRRAAKVAVSGLPAGVPAGLTRVVVEGIADQVSTSGWLRTMTVTPARRRTSRNVPLDTSTLGGSDLIAPREPLMAWTTRRRGPAARPSPPPPNTQLRDNLTFAATAKAVSRPDLRPVHA